MSLLVVPTVHRHQLFVVGTDFCVEFLLHFLILFLFGGVVIGQCTVERRQTHGFAVRRDSCADGIDIVQEIVEYAHTALCRTVRLLTDVQPQ